MATICHTSKNDGASHNQRPLLEIKLQSGDSSRQRISEVDKIRSIKSTWPHSQDSRQMPRSGTHESPSYDKRMENFGRYKFAWPSSPGQCAHPRGPPPLSSPAVVLRDLMEYDYLEVEFHTHYSLQISCDTLRWKQQRVETLQNN